MDKRFLGLSWLNGQFKAVAVNKTAVTGRWECPNPVNDEDNLVDVLKEAVKQTSFEGYYVALVLEHPRLTQQLVEAPPIVGHDLEMYLERRVTQLKFFSEEAAWCYQLTLPTKIAKGLMLHLFPMPFLDKLLQACRLSNLHLLKMFPPSAILKGQLTKLPLEGEEIALLAGEIQNTTTVVIGRKTGQIFLTRTLNASLNGNPDRAISELTRTILFCKQQFGQIVNSLWLFGAGASDYVNAITPRIDIPVRISPVTPDQYYWIEEGLKLHHTASDNLISKELQKAPQRRLMLRITSIMVGLLLIASLGTSAYVEAQVRQQLRTLARLKTKEAAELERKKELETRHAELKRKKQLAQVITEDYLPPIPAWFLGYIGEILPEQMALMEFNVERVQELWSVRLAGTVQPNTNQPLATALVESVLMLENQLQSGPYHVKITRSTRTDMESKQEPEPEPAGRPWMRRRNPEPASSNQPTSNDFFIEGVMR